MAATREQMEADMRTDMATMTPEQRIEYVQTLALLVGVTDVHQWLASIFAPAEQHECEPMRDDECPQCGSDLERVECPTCGGVPVEQATGWYCGACDADGMVLVCVVCRREERQQ